MPYWSNGIFWMYFKALYSDYTFLVCPKILDCRFVHAILVKWNIWIYLDDWYSDYTILVCNKILDCRVIHVILVKWNIWWCLFDQYSDYSIVVCNKIMGCCRFANAILVKGIILNIFQGLIFWLYYSGMRQGIGWSMQYWSNTNILIISWWLIF